MEGCKPAENSFSEGFPYLPLNFADSWTIITPMSSKLFAAVASVVLFTTNGAAAEGWSVLKAGMSRADTESALGDPMFKNVARGFEVWFYDRGAEVLCFQGFVVAWTAPAGVASPDGRQLDLTPFFQRAAVDIPAATPAEKTVTELQLTPVRQMRLPKL